MIDPKEEGKAFKEIVLVLLSAFLWFQRVFILKNVHTL